METNDIYSNQEKKKALFTHGNERIYYSHIGPAAIGAAIGVTIGSVTPITPVEPLVVDDDPTVTPETPITAMTGSEYIDTPVEHIITRPETFRPPKPEVTKPQPPRHEQTKPEEPRHDPPKPEEPRHDPENPSQEEIDRIAGNLVRDSHIDERDAVDESSILDFTDRVTLNMPNGMTVDGYIFNEELVLADLDGDGVYDNLLAVVDGEPREVVVPIMGTNGQPIMTLNEVIAQNHLTESDIEQLVSQERELNLAMTDPERRLIQQDDISHDIKILDGSSGGSEEGTLSQEEEDALLNDILGDPHHDVAESDVIDEEMVAVPNDGELLADMYNVQHVSSDADDSESSADDTYDTIDTEDSSSDYYG